MLFFIANALLTLFASSHAAPLSGGFHNRSFRMGSGIHNHVGFHSNFARNQNRGFFHRGRRFFFQQLAWPAYWIPYDYPYDYSYLNDGPEDNDQYSVASSDPGQPASYGPAADHGPLVVVINQGNPNSLPADPNANASYIHSVYGSTDRVGLPKTVVQDPNGKFDPPSDPRTVAPSTDPQTARTVAKGPQPTAPAQSGVFGNLVLVSWLEDAGKDVIYVQNTETKDVQKITSEPNLDNFRIVELHRSADPKLFEAVISNGSQQGPVRFRF
jgi:hypothetical protein